jgi:hypothetical protein
MTLRARIDRLQANRPKVEAGGLLTLDMPPDLCARIAKAQAAGTCPQSLCDADLSAILAAYDLARGQK